jgi:methionyl aminopeptidase
MISIKSEREIELLKVAGEIVGKTHHYLEPFIKPGITTKELDRLAEEYILSQGCTPSFKGLYGFPGSICISINEEVVHGIPGNRKLKNGDIVTLDIGACYKGYHGDSAWTYAVGKISPKKEALMKQTEEALFAGLSVIKDGCHVGDIGHAVEECAHKYHLGVVEELVGHGVGSQVHEEPDVPNYGKKGTGPVLKEGMVIAVEPMLNMGTKEVFMLDDDWTIVTGDDLPSAHFEHTVLVEKDGYTILTKR